MRIEVKVRMPSEWIERWILLARAEDVLVNRIVEKVLMLGEQELRDVSLVGHCYKCRRYKLRSEFFRDRSRPGGRESRCKICSTERRRANRG